mmetsp:Transcript_3978/g.11230  ORF Transcript_3978/g.11230 Transcript_3978/m.11230 type:complete len:258 (+) Transcript_3978:253-1026(+)
MLATRPIDDDADDDAAAVAVFVVATAVDDGGGMDDASCLMTLGRRVFLGKSDPPSSFCCSSRAQNRFLRMRLMLEMDSSVKSSSGEIPELGPCPTCALRRDACSVIILTNSGLNSTKSLMQCSMSRKRWKMALGNVVFDLAQSSPHVNSGAFRLRELWLRLEVSTSRRVGIGFLCGCSCCCCLEADGSVVAALEEEDAESSVLTVTAREDCGFAAVDSLAAPLAFLSTVAVAVAAAAAAATAAAWSSDDLSEVGAML